eukprot:5346128-Heterocapsa_arctica.AAC.1
MEEKRSWPKPGNNSYPFGPPSSKSRKYVTGTVANLPSNGQKDVHTGNGNPPLTLSKILARHNPSRWLHDRPQG